MSRKAEELQNNQVGEDVKESSYPSDKIQSPDNLIFSTISDSEKVKKPKSKKTPKSGSKSFDSDPIRSYLHDIAGHSLLSREEEIGIAKKLKKGRKIIAKAIIECPLMIKEVINLGEKIQKGALNIGEITQFDDYDENDEEILNSIRKSISIITKIHFENEQLNNRLKDSSAGKRQIEQTLQQIKKQ